jgi:hypothetical protein
VVFSPTLRRAVAPGSPQLLRPAARLARTRKRWGRSENGGELSLLGTAMVEDPHTPGRCEGGPTRLAPSLSVTPSVIGIRDSAWFFAAINVEPLSCLSVDMVKPHYPSVELRHAPTGHSVYETFGWEVGYPWGALRFGIRVKDDCLATVAIDPPKCALTGDPVRGTTVLRLADYIEMAPSTNIQCDPTADGAVLERRPLTTTASPHTPTINAATANGPKDSTRAMELGCLGLPGIWSGFGGICSSRLA